MPEAASRKPVPCDPMQALTERNRPLELTSFLRDEPTHHQYKTRASTRRVFKPCFRTSPAPLAHTHTQMFHIDPVPRTVARHRRWDCGVVDRSLRSQAGEGRGVAGVDGSAGLAAAGGCTGGAPVGALGASTAAGSVAASATKSALASPAAGGSISTAAAASETSAGAAATRLGGLDEALVDVDDLLLLALTLTLGLATGAGNEVLFFILGDCLGVGPLLVLLAALVGLAGLGDTGAELELLLGLLGKVVGVGDAVVLRLSLGLLGGSWGSLALLLVSLGNGIAGLLILQLGIALVGAPAVAGLLLGVTVEVRRDPSEAWD
jgi:hypothetical protein